MADPIFKDLAYAALAQTARNPNRDFLRATPRNPVLGYLSDLAAASYSPQRTQQMQGTAKFLGAPAIAETLDRLSYGEPLTTGAGGLGGTTRFRPEAIEAAMAVAPIAAPAARAVGAGAMAAGRAGERFAERAVPMVMERGGMGAELLQGMSRGTVSPMDVYHGSPHRFEKFDASKIGTGEGAQAYGHGLYLAEAPDVATTYSNLRAAPNMEFHTATGRKLTGLEKSIADDMLSNGMASARIGAKANGPEWMDAFNRIKDENITRGNLYKVDLPDEQIAKMLDWDKPLGQQSKEVKAAIQKTKSMLPPNAIDDLGGDLSLLYGPNVTPKDFLNTWESFGQKAGGESALQKLGIPGIRYLDGGSRSTGGGTSNFVVFPGNESMLTILERNNQPVQQAMQEFEQGLTNFMATK